jgi:hypothetical protein
VTFQLGPDDPATRETDILKRLELARSSESPIKATLENWTSALVFTVVAEKVRHPC